MPKIVQVTTEMYECVRCGAQYATKQEAERCEDLEYKKSYIEKLNPNSPAWEVGDFILDIKTGCVQEIIGKESLGHNLYPITINAYGHTERYQHDNFKVMVKREVARNARVELNMLVKQ